MNAIVFVAPQGGLISSHFITVWCLWRVEFALPAAPTNHVKHNMEVTKTGKMDKITIEK